MRWHLLSPSQLQQCIYYTPSVCAAHRLSANLTTPSPGRSSIAAATTTPAIFACTRRSPSPALSGKPHTLTVVGRLSRENTTRGSAPPAPAPPPPRPAVALERPPLPLPLLNEGKNKSKKHQSIASGWHAISSAGGMCTIITILPHSVKIITHSTLNPKTQSPQ